MPDNPFDTGGGGAANPFDVGGSERANPFDTGSGGGGLKKVASNVGDALDWQRSKSQELIFHKGSNDANRAALRQAMGVSREYDDPRLFGTGPGSFGIPVPEWATHLGRGLTDAGLDTATDPLTYEPMGEIAKLGHGAAGIAGKVVSAAQDAPIVGGAIKSAAEGVGNLAHVAQDYFTHGAAAAREPGVGKEGVDLAMGAKTKTASHADQLDRLLQARFEKIRAGMSDADFTTALQIQKGERQALTNEGRPLVSEAAIAGAAALKHLFRQAYALRADASGQARIANYGVGKQTTTREEPNLFRYQQTAGDPEISPIRSGTFFAPNRAEADFYNRPADRAGEGGPNLISRVANARNAFIMPKEVPEGTSYAAEALMKRGLPVPKRIETMSQQQQDTLAFRALRRLGVPESEARDLVFKGGIGKGTPTTLERLSAEYLRKKGHDAWIEPGGEFFALTPEATRPAVQGAKRVVAKVAPKVNEVEATRDIEQNNRARGRIVDRFAQEALPTIEQHPDYIAALQADREYRVGGKGFSEEQIAKNAEMRKAALAHRLAGDRFRAMPPKEQELAVVNAGGTRRVNSTGGNRYVTNTGTAWDATAADPLGKEIKPLEDAQRPIVDKSKRTFTVTGRAPSTPYAIDPDLAEFAGQPGTLSSRQFKHDYVPGIREAKPTDPNRAAQTYSLLDKFDPNALHQGEFTIDPANAAGHEAAIRGALSNTAAQVSRAELRKELEARFGGSLPPAVAKLFEVARPATGTARSKEQLLRDRWQQIVDMPKRAIVGVLPRHLINVASLGAINNPVATAKAVGQAARIVKNPASRYDELRPGIEAGAIGPRAEHDLAEPAWVGALLDKAGPIGGGIRNWGKAVNDATWAMDEAVVNQIAKAKGGGYSAGREARKALVDYDNPSRFTRHAKAVAPFATFEGNIPGAVAKAIARNPRGVEAANRATGGTLLGGDTQLGGHDVRLNLPPAKVGRLLGSGNLPEYARGGAADPVRFAISLATGLSAADKRHYMTYGLDPYKWADLRKILSNMALGGVPEARNVLDQLGDGPYTPRQNFFEELGQGATGVTVH
jgi:hypothetical protein